MDAYGPPAGPWVVPLHGKTRVISDQHTQVVRARGTTLGDTGLTPCKCRYQPNSASSSASATATQQCQCRHSGASISVMQVSGASVRLRLMPCCLAAHSSRLDVCWLCKVPCRQTHGMHDRLPPPSALLQATSVSAFESYRLWLRMVPLLPWQVRIIRATMYRLWGLQGYPGWPQALQCCDLFISWGSEVIPVEAQDVLDALKAAEAITDASAAARLNI